MQKKLGILFCVIGIIAIENPDGFCGESSLETAPLQPEIEMILEKAAYYCEMLSHAVLSFVCEERIREEIYPKVRVSSTRIYSTGRERSDYVYDYQLIRKGGEITEKRILIEENGQERYEEDAQLKLRTFFHKNIVFSPLDLLSRERQHLYSYTLEGRKKVNGERAFVIKVGPRPLDDDTGISGKLWVSAEDFSLLRIEWEQSALRNFEGVEQTAARLRAEPKIKIFTEFYFDKNGIRFPSRHVVQEGYVRNRRRIIISNTKVEYINYKFFTVEVDVSYRSIRKK